MEVHHGWVAFLGEGSDGGTGIFLIHIAAQTQPSNRASTLQRTASASSGRVLFQLLAAHSSGTDHTTSHIMRGSVNFTGFSQAPSAIVRKVVEGWQVAAMFTANTNPLQA